MAAAKNKPNLAAIAFFILLAILLASHKQIGRHYYPLKYKEAVFRYAYENGLNPFLVTAIIKVESNFQSNAVSPRGAIGLMQLMPQTGRWIAAEQGETFSRNLLFDPEINIRYGTWYLVFLNREFGNTTLALAAYNAGRGNVKKWLLNRTWSGKTADLDQIPFAETRQFVRKTVWIQQIYSYLYRSPTGINRQ